MTPSLFIYPPTKTKRNQGIPQEKPLSKEELVIVKFLENNYKLAYTADDIKKKFPDITRFSISYLLQSLANNKIIDTKTEVLRGRKIHYYMAKKKGGFYLELSKINKSNQVISGAPSTSIEPTTKRS
jgi:hypothetical protein